MARAALAQGNTARAGVGVADRKPNRLRGLSVEGEVPQPDLRGGETQADTLRPISSGNVRTRGKEPGRGERDHHAHPIPCPADLLPRGLSTRTPDALDQPEHPMPDFNLSVMSLAALRDLQKSVTKVISTFEARQKAEARDKVEML